MIEFKLPSPEFIEKRLTTPIVKVTLRNNVKQRKVWIDKDASNIVGVLLWDSLSEHERRIINFIAEHSTISVSQVQRLTKKSWPASSDILEGLKGKGIITDKRKRKGRDTSCRWMLVAKKGKG
jgi:predicted HTH transcriptional regulator